MCSTVKKSLNHCDPVFVAFTHCQDKVPAQENLKICCLRFIRLPVQREAIMVGKSQQQGLRQLATVNLQVA